MQAGRWFPDTSIVTPLLAAPRETAVRGTFLVTERSGHFAPDGRPADGNLFVRGDFEGMNVEADVALGYQLPVLLLFHDQDGGPSVALEFEVGIFSRFFMETRDKDLINTDYRVGLPLVAAWNGWEGRLELRHISSHVGDEFVERFGASDRGISQDGLELLIARRFGDGVRAYVAGETNLRRTRGLERRAGRVGIEYDPGLLQPERRAWPFAAFDLRLNDAAGRPEGSAVTGLALRFRGVGLRLEAGGHFGPSSMGWLRTADETYWGLGLRLAPRGF